MFLTCWNLSTAEAGNKDQGENWFTNPTAEKQQTWEDTLEWENFSWSKQPTGGVQIAHLPVLLRTTTYLRKSYLANGLKNNILNNLCMEPTLTSFNKPHQIFTSKKEVTALSSAWLLWKQFGLWMTSTGCTWRQEIKTFSSKLWILKINTCIYVLSNIFWNTSGMFLPILQKCRFKFRDHVDNRITEI